LINTLSRIARPRAILPCLAILAATGCASIFNLDAYSTDPPDGATSIGSPEGAGDDGGGDDAGPCRGPSCSAGTCIAFDNLSRIPGFAPDASLPSLPPAPSSGTSASSDAGSDGASDAASDGGAGEASAPTTSALPACSSLPQPVYIIGSSGLTSTAAELSALAATAPITVIYTIAHSCDGAKAIILNETSAATGATTANYWDISGTVHSCQIDAASEYADIGLGNVFADQCLTLPQGASGIGDFLGPVTPGALVVPNGSTQTAISAEALYYVEGLGMGGVAPWTSTQFLFVNASSGVELDFGLAIGVAPTHWVGTAVSSATQNVAMVTASAQPEETLGNMSTDLVEAANTSSAIKELAFQDFGQPCAYYPNSTATSADKENVRNGNYPIWGFTHMFTKVNAQSVPLNPNAATIINYFTGNLPTPSGNFLKYIINDHLVPVCAMQVTRTTEMGPLSPFSPSPSCGCYFDSIATGSTSCAKCTTAADCSSKTQQCNLGYCEGT
jgi:hypothetical protein